MKKPKCKNRYLNIIFTKLGLRKLLLAAAVVVFLGVAAVFALKNDNPGVSPTNTNGEKTANSNQTGSASVAIGSGSTSQNSTIKSGGSSSRSGSSSSRSSGATPTPTATPIVTPAPTPTPESITAYVAFFADTQSDTDEDQARAQTVMGYILDKGANPVFHAGDLLEDGTLDSLNRFNSACSALCAARTFYAAQGNNERDSSLYFDNFSFPNNERWYSVNIGNLHMVVLDVAFSSVAAGSAQYNWLASDLQSSESQNRVTGVIFHHPPYGSGGDTKGLIPTIVPLFRNYGVDFVISGHEHVYQKTEVDGVDYFITSGQTSIGYMTAAVYTSYTVVRYYNASNSLADTTTVNNR